MNNSSGKSRFTSEMLRNVSCLVAPPNGEHPVNIVYVNTPTLLQQQQKILYKITFGTNSTVTNKQKLMNLLHTKSV